MRELFVLNKYFLKYKWRFFSGILFVILSTILRVYNPSLVGDVIDNVIKSLNNPSTSDSEVDNILLQFLGVYVLVSILEGVFVFLNRQTIIVVSRMIEFDLKNSIYEQYQRLDLSFYRKNNTGDLMNRITEDVSRVRMYLGPAIMYLLGLFFTIIIVIPVLIYINPKMALYVLVPLPLLSFTIYYINNKIDIVSEKMQSLLSDLTSYAQEIFSGIRVVKSFSKEKEMTEWFNEESGKYRSEALKLAGLEALWFPSMNIFIGLSLILTIYMGGKEFLVGKISAGDIVKYIMYLNMLMWPVTSLGWVAGMIQRAITSQRRINEFLLMNPTINDGEIIKNDIKGNIKFQNVTLTYQETGITALKNISFEIKEGEKWAIIGKTGSGKTTIADLITKMFLPDSGEVLIDGISTVKYKNGNLRQKIGYVPQDLFLFSEKIMDNISFGLEKTELNEVVSYAKAASIHSEVENFYDGYDTIVGERGVTLSGGQKQRITIARALIKKPDILILDDCLSAVDTVTESSIQKSFSENLGKITTIIITHRIFKELHFDKIMVINNGEIEEIGTHEELMSTHGYYSRLYKIQREEYNEQ